ncbi:DUF1161 domain-containing protein [Undibacterium sp. Jales W-56]|uniref:DUF1161 domain-containing protein n=1 Tax=Undibacterium sp. Jales W-56 TaxID=2897325 RepID=UPI0021CF752E|nr:DUF1161 domain-containing protein [Undibacterium sp. Jales W-56]MCU6434167.1 DUF1161 domain-containing protein [Undibacterium sp. Jales W-56]
MKALILASSLILMSTSSMAAITPCVDMQEKVEKKLEGKGVKNYSLEVVDKDVPTNNRVVGVCEGGKKKIIYTKTKSGKALNQV